VTPCLNIGTCKLFTFRPELGNRAMVKVHDQLVYVTDRVLHRFWLWPLLDLGIISNKRLFFQFRGVKNKFHRFWPPWKTFWENPLLPPSWKKSFRRPCFGLAFFYRKNKQVNKKKYATIKLISLGTRSVLDISNCIGKKTIKNRQWRNFKRINSCFG